jgi:signal transduction histidine kinase
MVEPATPSDEAERLQDLRSLQVLDTPAEERFDRITRLTRRLLGVPVALISLVDADRQWFKSRQGIELTEVPRDGSFCDHAILCDELFVVHDARADARFADNACVHGTAGIRFYAGAPLRAASGRKIGALCALDCVPRELSRDQRDSLRDLADWVESELANTALTEAVSALEAELGRRSAFVSVIAHEVRTPLTSIRASLGLMAADPALCVPSQVQNMVAIASRNAARLSKLLDEFVAIEKLAAGVAFFKPISVDLMTVLTEAIEADLPTAQSREVRLTLTRAAPGTVVHADPERLRQAFANVLSNAIKFSPPRQAVEICADAAGHAVRITIADKGPGIPAEFQARLFQKFSQADSSDSRSQPGTGVGLALTRGLIERMGGTIEVWSPPAGGTLVTLELPILRSQTPDTFPDTPLA